jgi:hypothetical protein
VKWPGQDLGKVTEFPGLTYLLMKWLSEVAKRYPDLTPEQILVSLERVRHIVTETTILKRP